MRLVLRFGHGKPGRSAARLSGTGAAALAGGAVAEKGSPSVRSGATSRGPSAVGQSPLGPATGGSWAVRFEESGARWTQTSPECRRPEEDRARAEARARSTGLRNRFVDGVAGGPPGLRGSRWPLPRLAGSWLSCAIKGEARRFQPGRRGGGGGEDFGFRSQGVAG